MSPSNKTTGGKDAQALDQEEIIPLVLLVSTLPDVLELQAWLQASIGRQRTLISRSTQCREGQVRASSTSLRLHWSWLVQYAMGQAIHTVF